LWSESIQRPDAAAVWVALDWSVPQVSDRADTAMREDDLCLCCEGISRLTVGVQKVSIGLSPGSSTGTGRRLRAVRDVSGDKAGRGSVA
jgi:hypothetical protein